MEFTKTTFFIGLAVLLFMPIYPNYTFLLNGKLTKGIVVGYNSSHKVKYSKEGNRPVIRFEVDGKAYKFAGPLDTGYLIKEEVNVVYHKDDPENAIILSFLGIFGNIYSALAFIVMILWTALFFTRNNYVL